MLYIYIYIYISNSKRLPSYSLQITENFHSPPLPATHFHKIFSLFSQVTELELSPPDSGHLKLLAPNGFSAPPRCRYEIHRPDLGLASVASPSTERSARARCADCARCGGCPDRPS